MSDPKHTPLTSLHEALGAKMVDFAGWYMPVQFEGIIAEHTQCREKAALFDVSHMGQVILRGDNVAQELEKLVPADIVNLPEGKARYTFFTNDKGGILDDLIISNAGDYFYVVVNASMRDQDIGHMRDNLNGVELTELTDQGLIALQGPRAEGVLVGFCAAAAHLNFMETMEAEIDGVPVRISRLGYTGEDGYEISMPAGEAEKIAKALLDHDDCEPAGLGARDSLRMEAGLCLYGNDITQDTSPIEAGLIWAIQKRRRSEGGFPGDAVIQGQVADGATRKLVGIRPEGRAPARAGTEICDADGNVIGEITSGGFGPTVGAPVAMGYVATGHHDAGTAVTLMIRGKPHGAEVAKLPFVKQNYKRED